MNAMMRLVRFLVIVGAVCGLLAQPGSSAAASPIACYGADYGQVRGAYFLFSDGGQWYVLLDDVSRRPIGVGQTSAAWIWWTWDDYQAQTGVSDRPTYKVACGDSFYPFWGHSLKLENGVWYLVYTVGSVYGLGTTATMRVESLEDALANLVYLDEINRRPAPTDPYLSCIWINDPNIDYDRDSYVGVSELAEYCDRYR
jgi:hypothetical protein